jgi:ABC-type nitrate/sulfonate/bicarbonate transport system permease component
VIEAALDKKWPVALAFSALMLLGWQLAGAAGALPEYIVTPSSVVAGIADLVSSGELWDLLIPSLKRSFTGFFIGSTLGVIVGLLTGISRPAAELLELPVSFTYPLPKIALFPALAILFGFNDTTRIIVIALACFYPAYLNANLGTRSINPMFVQLAHNVEASRIRTFFQVIVPAALPRIFTGLQICLGVSFILLFATEIIGFSDGVGSDILKSSRDAKYERMYSGIAVLGLAGFLSNRLLILIGKVVTRGRLSGGVADD